jgi:hypothetical protein
MVDRYPPSLSLGQGLNEMESGSVPEMNISEKALRCVHPFRGVESRS